jgi:hypothetical protein
MMFFPVFFSSLFIFHASSLEYFSVLTAPSLPPAGKRFLEAFILQQLSLPVRGLVIFI